MAPLMEQDNNVFTWSQYLVLGFINAYEPQIDQNGAITLRV